MSRQFCPICHGRANDKMCYDCDWTWTSPMERLAKRRAEIDERARTDSAFAAWLEEIEARIKARVARQLEDYVEEPS